MEINVLGQFFIKFAAVSAFEILAANFHKFGVIIPPLDETLSPPMTDVPREKQEFAQINTNRFFLLHVPLIPQTNLQYIHPYCLTLLNAVIPYYPPLPRFVCKDERCISFAVRDSCVSNSGDVGERAVEVRLIK